MAKSCILCDPSDGYACPGHREEFGGSAFPWDAYELLEAARVEVVPASSFPGLRPPAWAPHPKAVHTLGTTVDSEWTHWYASTPPPARGEP
jgi:hypothetical protein